MATEYCFLWIDWWPLCMTKAEWSGWVQAVGSVAAIAAGAFAVWWQVHRQANNDKSQLVEEEVRRLQIVGATLFECRVATYSIESASKTTFTVESEVNELAAMLRSLSAIAPLDLPDWRAGYAISSVAITFASVEDGLRKVPSLTSTTHEKRMAYINTIDAALDFSEGLLRECLVDRKADLLAILHSHNGFDLKSKSYIGPGD